MEQLTQTKGSLWWNSISQQNGHVLKIWLVYQTYGHRWPLPPNAKFLIDHKLAATRAFVSKCCVCFSLPWCGGSKKNVITFAEWYWLMRTFLSHAAAMEDWSLKSKTKEGARWEQTRRRKKCEWQWQRRAVSWNRTRGDRGGDGAAARNPPQKPCKKFQRKVADWKRLAEEVAEGKRTLRRNGG